MAGKMIEVTCNCCPDKFMARVADRKRGWARFCSKSCAAYFKTYGKRRKHQTAEMRASAAFRNDIERLQREEALGSHEYDDCAYAFFGEFEDHNKGDD